MKHWNAIGIGLALLGVVMVSQAQAQVEPPRAAIVPSPHPGLSSAEVLAIVRASGLTPLTQPARQGANYVVLASDNMGGQLRVVVGANRRILHASPAHDPRFAYYAVRPRGYIPVAPPYGAAPAPSREVLPPPGLTEPPRAARAPALPVSAPQDPRPASAPDITSSVPTRSTPTPLPRPRPAVAANEAVPQAIQSVPEVPAAAAMAPAGRPATSPPITAVKPVQPTETQMVPVAPLD